MPETFVSRQLSFQHDRVATVIDAHAALNDPRLVGRPLIVLGEAGSGKSELLRHWGGNTVATARQVTNGWCVGEGRSFVDGLDEAASLQDGDALERVLGALGAQRNSDFVLACRVADWRSASAVAVIKSWTGVEPVELTIEPLGRADIVEFLRARTGLGFIDAEAFVEHYEQRGFAEWLGNPQTLMMLAKVALDGTRPETTGELFAQFVDRTWQEYRKQSGALATASKTEVLDALGALFAALIVGGYEALTIAPGAQQRDGDLPLAECWQLPGIAHLAEGRLDAFLGSRLIIGCGSDRFTYQHRRIGEYLGAGWLASRATTTELQSRLLAALRQGDMVPSTLRGLWGWLAADGALGIGAINADPLAVIEYGNADTLGPAAARALLAAVEEAEDRHETFGRRDYHASALVQPALAQEVERILAMPGEARIWTQLVLLLQFRDAGVVKRHEATLRTLIFDEARPYAIRDAAADALADHGSLPDWPAIIKQLVGGQVRESLRLALVMMLNPTVGLTLTNAEFAETVYSYSGLTPRFTGSREVGTVSLYYLGRRQAVGNERLDGLLDALTHFANQYLDGLHSTDAWDVQRLFYAMLERRIALGEVDEEALWRWLNADGHGDNGATREARERIDKWLQANTTIRRVLQRKVLDSCFEKPRSLGRRFREVALGLLPTVDDVIALLDWLPAGDPRWRELIWFAPRRQDGEAARRAAHRHVDNEEDRQALQDHANPPPLEWKKKDAEREAERKSEKEARNSELRADYIANRERMRRGEYGAIVGPAQVYVGRVYDADSGLLPEQRVAAWIGDDLQADAFTGFEAFLAIEPPKPTAAEIAETHALSRSWSAALIIVAALRERFRSARGFADLSDERVQAGLLELVAGLIDDDEWKPLRAALAEELAQRGVWEVYARMLIESQLKRRASYPTGLWEVLATPAGTKLAAEWLRNFPRVAAEPEEALIDHLLLDGSPTSRAALIDVATRRRRGTLDERRKRNWQAIELILGLSPSARVTELASEDPTFLWVLRNRMGWRRGNGATTVVPSPTLLAAIVGAFAPLYPQASMRSGTSTGDVNPWDASEFIFNCLNMLAADPTANAGSALATLASIGHGYASTVGRSVADQRRARANAEWRPHSVIALAKLVSDGPPVDHEDLQRVLLAELDIVQAKIKSSDADVRRFFYDGASPKLEEPCTDALITLLRQTDRPLTFTIEAHLGDNREGDIWCESGTFAVAIECKRHWHADLWTAFDWQLSKQQSTDWRARGHGVYVVYWFGAEAHSVTGPPRGSRIKKPLTPEALEAALRQRISDERLPSIAVKVLDLYRLPAA